MKHLRKYLFGLMVFLSVALLATGMRAKADADYNWDEMKHYDISSMSEYFESVALVYDENYLYIHLIQKSMFHEYKDTYLPGMHDHDGTIDWSRYNMPDSVGKTSDGRVSVEIRIPLTHGLGENYLTFDFDKNGESDSVLLPEFAPDSMQEHEYEEPEYTNDFNIVIDGYYEDWEGIPHDFVNTGKYNPYYNNDQKKNDRNGYIKYNKDPKWHKQLAMVNDGEYVYIHIKTEADGRGEHISGKGMSIEVDGQILYFDLCDSDGKPINGARWGEGIFEAYLYTADNNNTLLENCSAYVTIVDERCEYKHDYEACHKNHYYHRSDECEIAISFDTLSKLLNVNMDEFGEIIFSDPNTGSVMNSGSSSGPLIGISICVAVSCIGFVTIKRRKKAVK